MKSEYLQVKLQFWTGSKAAVAFGLLMMCSILPASAQNLNLSLGKVPWDISTADVSLQQLSSDQVAVTVGILTHTSAPQMRTRPVPAGAIQAWLLSEDGAVLEQLPRQPAAGSPLIEVASAGESFAIASFKFKFPEKSSIAAAIVQIEDRIHVFPKPLNSTSVGAKALVTRDSAGNPLLQVYISRPYNAPGIRSSDLSVEVIVPNDSGELKPFNGEYLIAISKGAGGRSDHGNYGISESDFETIQQVAVSYLGELWVLGVRKSIR